MDFYHKAAGAHLLALVATAVFMVLLAGGAYASEELAESESMACTVCHHKPGSKRLTDQGKYFELMRSMDGYADLESSFGKCTFCHRRKPGSKKLTRAGKGFANALGNMQALVEWVQELHPAWPEVEEEDLMEPTGQTGGADPEGSAPRLLPAH